MPWPLVPADSDGLRLPLVVEQVLFRDDGPSCVPGRLPADMEVGQPNAMHELRGEEVIAGREIDFGLLIGCAAATT